jgi:hypothetical protein
MEDMQKNVRLSKRICQPMSILLQGRQGLGPESTISQVDAPCDSSLGNKFLLKCDCCLMNV